MYTPLWLQMRNVHPNKIKRAWFTPQPYIKLKMLNLLPNHLLSYKFLIYSPIIY